MSRASRLTLAITLPSALFVWCWWWPFAPDPLHWDTGWTMVVINLPLTVACAVGFLRITHPRNNEGR